MLHVEGRGRNCDHLYPTTLSACLYPIRKDVWNDAITDQLSHVVLKHKPSFIAKPLSGTESLQLYNIGFMLHLHSLYPVFCDFMWQCYSAAYRPGVATTGFWIVFVLMKIFLDTLLHLQEYFLEIQKKKRILEPSVPSLQFLQASC